MHSGIRSIRPRFHPSRQAATGRAHRAARRRLRGTTGALARQRGVLAWPWTRSFTRDRATDPELDTHAHLQEHPAVTKERRRYGCEDSGDAGGEPAPLLQLRPEAARGSSLTCWLVQERDSLLPGHLRPWHAIHQALLP